MKAASSGGGKVSQPQLQSEASGTLCRKRAAEGEAEGHVHSIPSDLLPSASAASGGRKHASASAPLPPRAPAAAAAPSQSLHANGSVATPAMVADAAAAQASYDAAPAENAAKAAAAEVAVEPTLRVSRLAPASGAVSQPGGLRFSCKVDISMCAS